MVIPVMGSAQRYGELVADLSSYRARLSETQMVGVGGTPPANQTGLRGNELEVRFMAMPARLANRELAFFDFAGEASVRECVEADGLSSLVGFDATEGGAV